MKRLFLIIFSISFFISCSERTEPEFYYIKNNSDYPILISYDDTSLIIKSKENSIINTKSNISYSLNQNIVTFLNENSEAEKDEIKCISEESYIGFYNGSCCNIISFSNNSALQNNKYFYYIQNISSNDIIMYCDSFSYKTLEVDSNETKSVTFFYKNPEIVFFTKNDFEDYLKETNDEKKQAFLIEKSFKITKKPEIQKTANFLFYNYFLIIN